MQKINIVLVHGATYEDRELASIWQYEMEFHEIIAVVQVNGIIIIIWEAKGPATTRCPRQLRRLLYPKKQLKNEPVRNYIGLWKK